MIYHPSLAPLILRGFVLQTIVIFQGKAQLKNIVAAVRVSTWGFCFAPEFGIDFVS